MVNPDPSPSTLSALEAEIAELRAEMSALRQELSPRRPASSAPPFAQMASTPHPAVVEAAESDAAPGAAPDVTQDAAANAPTAKRGTSRRGLLRGAAVGAAAAAAAVAVSAAAEPAHAAPLTSGGNFVLGYTNDADTTTILIPTTSTSPYPLMRVDSTANSSVALEVWGDSGLGALNISGGTGIGAWINSGASDAVLGNASSGISLNAAGAGRIAQNPQSTAGAPTGSGTTYITGEQIRDSAGEMWICTAGGAPGTWVRLLHANAGASGGAITFLSSPMRLLDTRSGASAAITPNTQFGPGNHYIQVNGITYNSETIPSNTTGVLGNVQTINAAGTGYLAVTPANVGFSGTSNLVFEPGQIIANAFTSAVGVYLASVYPYFRYATGLDIYVNAYPVDVIIDIFAVIA